MKRATADWRVARVTALAARKVERAEALAAEWEQAARESGAGQFRDTVTQFAADLRGALAETPA